MVSRPFDNPEKPWLPGHRGVDLVADVGQPVLAAQQGVVAFAGVVVGTPTVSIDHPDGLRTTYQPVEAVVVKGQVVSVGEVIGTLAAPVDQWPGLQWGARLDRDTYVDPMLLLTPPVIRLKPVVL
ncbi:M23 family metallopeptidase [Corynebacterium aquilae]|uniref:Membrane protein n=1 Tax=Corynebacterium aquilae DSM 44791 TaxID=1431546 RepID=A0A1L7CGL2_9CORY|nr:peptidoglycan DD-metalloendopeptidase family protein [Corynebacterium aquilae]APT85002.1 membrane protein [Corynebacterium aquilae DSM 44791]